jgi:hypothetical protein
MSHVKVAKTIQNYSSSRRQSLVSDKKITSCECFRILPRKLRIAEARDNPLQFQARNLMHGDEAYEGTPPEYLDAAERE